MAGTRVSAIDAIGAARVLPVLRAPSADEVIAQAGALLSAGLRVVELTATTPEWERALTSVRAAHPDAVVGLGTVFDAAVAGRAVDLGAEFLVSPCPAPAARGAAGDVPFIEGGLTPGELAGALRDGRVAKLFPAHAVGPGYLRSLLPVFPGARIVPTGGITLANAGEWLAAGAFAVGVGSDLAKGDVAQRLQAAGL
jgi:2-dehydro-3-deoxyphosphogluconate aldolase/(4S)-4-hydroxy-2-oxoglutarate aldolase